MDKNSRALRSNSSPAVPEKGKGTEVHPETPVTLLQLKSALQDCVADINCRVDAILDKRLEILSTEIRSSFESKIKHLESIIQKQADEIGELKSRQQMADGKLNAVAFSTHQRMRREIQTNVVISGIPEKAENEVEIPEKAKEVLRTLDCYESVIVHHGRVGKSNNGKPRLLKITFRYLSDKVKAVRNAKRLRDDANFHGVFLNSDQTFAERREHKRLRDLASQMRIKNPDDDVFLHRGNLTVNGTIVESATPHRLLFR